jgi:hypothetical protein
LLEIEQQMHSGLLKWAYEVGGVIVTSKKLEQSSSREVMAGILPVTVPVTARAQLLAWHLGLLKTTERTVCPKARNMTGVKNFMVEVSKENHGSVWWLELVANFCAKEYNG